MFNWSKVAFRSIRMEEIEGVEVGSPYRVEAEVFLGELGPEDVVAHGEKMGVIRRETHPLGDLILMRESEAVLMSYFLNNVLHLLAIPGLVAVCFIQSRRLALAEVVRLVGLTYPYVRAELFLRWRGGEVEALVREVISEGQRHVVPSFLKMAGFRLIQCEIDTYSGRSSLPRSARTNCTH